MPHNLPRLRRHIDRVDRRLLALFNQRARLALRVGRVKRTHKLPVFDPKREAAVLRRLVRANRGPLSGASIRQIFQRVLSQSRRLERSG